MSKKYYVGIVGYGDFTKLMIEYLAPYAKIYVSSRRNVSGPAGNNTEFADIKTVLSQPIIIPSIPSQFFETFFSEHSSKINPDSIIIDVCSVKVHPLSVLLSHVPNTCQIIGTHPMFGPASAAENKGIKGLKCVVAPIRAEQKTIEKLQDFLTKKLKLKVINKTPEQHDREMAYVQGLSHYVGRIMQQMKLPESELATLAYEDLIGMKNIQGSDSWEVFSSIMTDNPYARQVNDEFHRAAAALDNEIWTEE